MYIKASLLSNQPGYKPVRRRRKPTTNITVNLANNTRPTQINKGFLPRNA